MSGQGVHYVELCFSKLRNGKKVPESLCDLLSVIEAPFELHMNTGVHEKLLESLHNRRIFDMHSTQKLRLILIASLAIMSSCRSTNANVLSTDSKPTFRFGQSQTPCFNPRIISDQRNSRRVISVINNEISTWDLESGAKISTSVNSGIGFAYDATLIAQQNALLIASQSGVVLSDLKSGRSKVNFYDPDGTRDLIFYTIGSSTDGRIAGATGLVTWPHKIPDVTGLGVSSEEWTDALALQEQKLLLLNIESGKIIGKVNFKDSFVHTLFFSSDLKFAITISYQTVSFWDIKDPGSIKLTKKIDIKDLNTPDTSVQVMAAAALSSDLRLAAISSDAGVLVIDIESQKLAKILPWAGRTGIRLIRYLRWSGDNRFIFGSDLQGIITEWSLTKDSINLLKTYPLGSGNQGTIIANSSSGSPHASLLVEPDHGYFIHPGQVEDENSFGQCQGFELVHFE